MAKAIILNAEMTSNQDKQIEEAVRSNRKRLMDFIRQRINDATEAEDILQDVFEELTEAFRLTEPIRQTGAWLMQVTRNKIIDRYRKMKPDRLEDQQIRFNDEESLLLADILPDPESATDDKYDNNLIWSVVEEALDELPEEQRDVFVWHELEGKSFNEISAITGASVNTLLSRKRYAVLYLRAKLRDIYDEMV